MVWDIPNALNTAESRPITFSFHFTSLQPISFQLELFARPFAEKNTVTIQSTAIILDSPPTEGLARVHERFEVGPRGGWQRLPKVFLWLPLVVLGRRRRRAHDPLLSLPPLVLRLPLPEAVAPVAVDGDRGPLRNAGQTLSPVDGASPVLSDCPTTAGAAGLGGVG